MPKKIITTDDAPKPIGPYSQAVRCGNMLFISGQLPKDPKTGEIVGDDISAQTTQALKNIQAICEADGMTIKDIVKVTCFLTDMGNYAAFNEAYATFFGGEYPARECVGVTGLPADIHVGISAICVE